MLMDGFIKRQEWAWRQQALIFWSVYAELSGGLELSPRSQTQSSRPTPSQSTGRGHKVGNDGKPYIEVGADALMAIVTSPFG